MVRKYGFFGTDSWKDRLSSPAIPGIIVKFQCSCAYDQVGVKYFFKDLNRCSETRFSKKPAPFPVMLNAPYAFEDFFPYKPSAFFFSLQAVKPKSKHNSNILILCPTKIKLFKQRRKDLCSRSRPGYIAYDDCNLRIRVYNLGKASAFYRIFKRLLDQKRGIFLYFRFRRQDNTGHIFFRNTQLKNPASVSYWNRFYICSHANSDVFGLML